MRFNTIIDNQSLKMEFSDSLDKLLIKTGNNIEIDCVQLNENSYSLILNGKSYYVTLNYHVQGYEITKDHDTHIVRVQDELEILLEKFGMKTDATIHAGEIYAQIPGLISQFIVKEGDKITVDQKLFILEAMKMENEINSPISGTVYQIYYKSGDRVEKGNLIMEIKN